MQTLGKGSTFADIIYEVLPNGFNGQLMIVGGITPPRSANVEVVDFSGTTDGRCGEETEDYSIAAFELVSTGFFSAENKFVGVVQALAMSTYFRWEPH